MADRALTFANGAALAGKHTRRDRPVVETTTTTIHASDIASRADTCQTSPVRLLTVSRIDPRKGLRVLPAAARLLAEDGIDLRLDIVGPTVGGPGRDERAAIVEDAARLGVSDRVAIVGAVALDRLLPMYGGYDVFVLPTLPGEGIPRVLLEAMSAGLPVVTTRVAGIPSLVTNEVNGLLVEDSTAGEVAGAIARIVRDARLRRSLIAQGYETARKFTLEAQAARMMAVVSDRLQVALRHPVVLPAA
jgi:glycosyltransferase involved in cell wall biosynthesis